MINHNRQYYRDGYLDVPFCSKCGKEGSELVAECISLSYNQSEIDLKNKLTDLGNRIKKQTLNKSFNRENLNKRN